MTRPRTSSSAPIARWTEPIGRPSQPLTASAIARLVGGVLHGPDREVTSVAPLQDAGPDAVAYSDRDVPAQSAAGVLLVRAVVGDRSCVVVDQPRLAFGRLLAHLFPEVHEPGVHVGAFVHPTAVLGQDVVVYPGAYIGPGCVVGDRSVIFPNAVLYPRTVVGPDCRVHAGAVLGSDGFGYEAGPQGPVKIPQVGRVRLDARVEVGANTCVDRATLDETVIGDDSKLDNLVQVAHNNRLGRGVILAAQAGLSGSVTVGDGVVMGGQAGIADHATIGAGAQIGAGAGITSSAEPGQAYLGRPAVKRADARRMWVSMRLLPELIRRVRKLERD